MEIALQNGFNNVIKLLDFWPKKHHAQLSKLMILLDSANSSKGRKANRIGKNSHYNNNIKINTLVYWEKF